MKFGKIFIIGVAALGGVAVYKARLYFTDPDAASGSEPGFYSSVTGPGSLTQTYKAANAERIASTSSSEGYRSAPSQPVFQRANKSVNGLNQSPPVDEVIVNDMPLINAAAKGDASKVSERLAQQARVDSRDGLRRTPLMYASWNGNQDICERLLAAGANPELRDRNENNAFDYAASRGQIAMVDFLLKRTRTSDQHYMEYAQLMQAVYAGDPARMPTGTANLPSINHINPEGQAPLHIAAGNGSVALMAALIQRGADVNLANADRQTPLLWAAWNNQAEAVALLIKSGADLEKSDLGGDTPLMLAAQNNSVNAAKTLIASGANKYTANKQGRTAALLAEDKGFKELANLLK